MLAVQDFHIQIEDRKLVQNFNLNVFPGEFVLLSGPSGSGKTTLLRMIAGLKNPKQGGVQFNKQMIAAKDYPKFRSQVIYVAQMPLMIAGTIEENFKKAFSFNAVQASYDEKQAGELLARLGLEALSLTQDVKGLSGGEIQRLSLIRALLIKPKIILLDEPVSSLDEVTAQKVSGLLQAEKKAGLAAIIVSHQRDWLKEMVDREVSL
jgi:putative ABC transport system ATP-binding protein